MPRASALLFVLGCALAATLAASGALSACARGDDASPPPKATTDAAAGADVVVGSPEDAGGASGPHCTMEDIAPGKGTKFCDLPGPDAAGFEVPDGFCIREFTTTPVKTARVLAFAPNGDLFVAAPSTITIGGAEGGPGAIVVLPDDDRDGRADAVLTYAGPSPGNGAPCASLEADPSSLACVHGLLFHDGYVYYTRSDEVRRFPFTTGERVAPSAAGELVASLGGKGISDVRWTHTLERTREGSIYVSRGRGDTSACSAEEMTRGAVFAIHVESKAPLPLPLDLVADGFRNPMYLRCSPSSCGDCYASELSGDNWDGVGGREKLALLDSRGDSWGYPCCVGLDLPAPDWGSHGCGGIGRELVAIPLHDTNFGLDFDRGGFPAPYRHGAFVALHGVFTSFGGTAVIWIPADPVSLRPTGQPRVFVKGFAPQGRATDAVFAPDGRLFIADDTTGKIYWVAPRSLAAPE